MDKQAFHQKYHGERVFLIGNGPSLSETDLHRLADEYTIATNKISRIFPDTQWRPSIFWFSQLRPERDLVESAKEAIDLGIPSFVIEDNRPIFGPLENVHYLNVQKLKGPQGIDYRWFHEATVDEVRNMSVDTLSDIWSDDITNVVYGYHAMYSMLQLAVYLGFKEIYLVGCDLGMGYHDPHMIFDSGLDPMVYVDSDSGSKWSFIQDAWNEGVLGRSLVNGSVYRLYDTPFYKIHGRLLNLAGSLADPNHFDPSYHKRPRDNRYVNDEIRKSHIVTKKISDRRGVGIYNATIGGELEVYDRVDLDDVITSE